MKRLAGLIAALAALALPASAPAHTDFLNISQTRLNNVFESGIGFTNMPCWSSVQLNPGQVRYLWHVDSPQPSIHWGVALFDYKVSSAHLHPPTYDADFLDGRRYFSWPEFGGTELGTRRITVQNGFFPNGTPVWKVNHLGGNGVIVIRANC